MEQAALVLDIVSNSDVYLVCVIDGLLDFCCFLEKRKDIYVIYERDFK